ncbi:ribosome small subunit-dependent GTPase A [bacterium (Candidatus Blackallbacteria) CG17_big_fil_post_rev_8_21_14_2_50_48_46]|uniref:Small ribosomal subunit biogenesis GTPase RsgA n=1 Tax=bacterium (Candidatus Blackallbacteria) CG17_big_fil_post_rev_8_21_14_2_50_48_46 TaxID=2014261 RepID=A0A2M7GBG7_9BACT|nr:MAG: ribosome small subunit-dependent GTPase A [bacterium (Candidatus Blackallbacteria) CG18_big_fil_WC_8_21_14_2_50_49_26]PIW19518.1 MAG: ribosome small subunit-dependent GTPase A [bacterium (Candidatus Blackallbacteria) CG17_big_fil_post_rev_8_21_14_2_50_48_46]PIW48878.1 MAG: ribosome small subunit-dependent GTPase A [bacterium (Candidatus Blackallbacteria) CG13_big_fil_rev_8_21_14_2_50_49_14]
MSPQDSLSGLVIKVEANFYSVAWGDQVFLCTLRANLKKAGETIKVGDRVQLENIHEERPVVVSFEPRRNELQRPAIANIDQVLLVMSCLQPDFNANLIDRLILAVSWERLNPVICVSKADLLDEDLEAWLREEYAAFPLYFVSSATGQGLDPLRKALMGKISVLAGPSGAGKSSLINRINPECQLVTGEVNQKLGTGKHTTRHVSLHAVHWQNETGWIADSPGFSACDLPPLEPAELASFYPEFKAWLGKCGFSDCLHREELDCAIKDHLDTDSERYYNYLRLLLEVEERFKARMATSTKNEKLTKKAVGKNNQNLVLKLGTVGRARSRRTQRQALEQVGNWAELDPQAVEDISPEEWRL